MFPTRLILFLVIWYPSAESFLRDKACYGDLGCFDNKGPWFSTARPFPLPMPPEKIKTQFYLHTRADSKRKLIQTRPKIRLEGTGYDPNKWTIIAIHGFASDTVANWMQDLMEGFLKNIDANVFLTDWSAGAKLVNYLQAAANTRVVGAEVARLGKHLVSNMKQSPKKIHCIGHSLGAHICGYMGKSMKESGMKIDWITGLDPAGPGFELTPPITRLSSEDADFVDAYHTDAKPIVPFLGFGIMASIAHVDFYMNGGALQPGCSTANVRHIMPHMPKITSIMDLGKMEVEKLANWIKCPHSRAAEYYISSLNGCAFVGTEYKFSFSAVMNIHFTHRDEPKECQKSNKKCQIVGLLAREAAGRGSFNVPTSAKPPYCLPLGKRRLSWLTDTLLAVKHKMKKIGLTATSVVNDLLTTTMKIIGGIHHGVKDAADQVAGIVGKLKGLTIFG